MKILLVDDSERLRRSLRIGLEREGFVVDCAVDGEDALQFLASYDYDVMVLDLMMPRLDGASVIRRIRARGADLHVLVLSAKGRAEERTMVLNLGADDFLVKPFSFDELCARIRALSRRRQAKKSSSLDLGALSIDTSTRTARVGATRLPLTSAEFTVLETMARRRGRPVSCETLAESIHAASAETSSNVIEVLISRLRRKLAAASVLGLISTRRGEGYLIE